MQERTREKWFAIWGRVAEFPRLTLIEVEKQIPNELIGFKFQPRDNVRKKGKKGRKKIESGAGEEGQEEQAGAAPS